MSSITAELLIDLSKIKKNICSLKSLIGKDSNFMAIVKSDAYGHDLKRLVVHIDDIVDAYGVVRLDEAVSLRRHTQKQILLMQGIYDDLEWNIVKDNSINFVVHDPIQFKFLERRYPGQKFWIKVNTGMNRLGISLDDLKEVLQKANLQNDDVLMTHLACADIPDDEMNLLQFANFEKAFSQLNCPIQRSILNTNGIINFPQHAYDWVRGGIGMYGGVHHPDLETAMTFRSQIISIRDIQPGDRVGYGGRQQAKTKMKIANVYVGYADGVPQNSIDGTKVLVNDQYAPIFGRVSMDLISVDISKIDNCKVGDWVVLWGDNISINKFAETNSLISYELMTKISPRVKKIFVEL